MASIDHPRPFRVLVSEPGGPAVQVEVDVHYRPHRYRDNSNVICLTIETFSLKQFEADVDELIAELKCLKIEAQGIFAAAKPRT